METSGKMNGWTGLVLVIVVTIAGWATSAGMMWQHIADVDRHVENIEHKLDQLIESEQKDHR